MLEVSHLAVDHGSSARCGTSASGSREGERVALLGANGAGKSTTLGAIIGLYPSGGGTIRYRGSEITGRDTAANVEDGIALVPEGRRLFPEMTRAREPGDGRLCAQQAPRASRETLERCYALFPVLRGEGAASRRASSRGGQQQMVAIGRALMSRPRLLLLDEPFLGVAPIVIEEVMGAFAARRTRASRSCWSSRTSTARMDFVARAYVIENGRTVLEGTRASLLGDAGFTSKFLGLE